MKFYSYYGGKNDTKLQKKIQKLIPKHKISLEPYAGSTSTSLNKVRSKSEIISDGDEDISHLLSVMADKEKGKVLKEKLKQLNIDKSDFDDAQRAKVYNYYGMDDVERAVCIFIVICFSFNSSRKNYRGIDIKDYQRRINKNIDMVYERLQGVEVKCMDAIDLINMYKEKENVFMVLDPPYVSWLRTVEEVYCCSAN